MAKRKQHDNNEEVDVPVRHSNRRRVKEGTGIKQVKEKFKQDRENRVNSNPLVPMNNLQKEYIKQIYDKSLVIATGYAGTSKTYIPTVIACDMLQLGQIDQIYLSRPNISNSKSLGYFSGDVVEKLSVWMGPVLSTMKDRLGHETLNIYIKRGDIQFIPVEVIKGFSFRSGQFVLIDEAEDLSVDEAKKAVTRCGGGKMVLCGDILQSELKEKSGLRWLAEMVHKYPELQSHTGIIDFNRASDIVRSRECKEWILAMRKEGEMGV